MTEIQLGKKYSSKDKVDSKLEIKKKTWKRIQDSKISEFFQGINIFNILNESYFGIAKNIIYKIFGFEHAKEYNLPKVIVIGQESAGKSCLLENITKCQLFPRNVTCCTRCPIHVKLYNVQNISDIKYEIAYKNEKIQIKDKYEIINKISEIFTKIGNTITEDEITVSISEINVPAFEFYDLPGIKAYPADLAAKTTNLCKKYLQDPNTIILCVVPATITILTTCQSIALIKSLNLQKKSILALTMADRVQEENIEDLLVQRITKISDEIKDLDFYNYIAVINRMHTDAVNLTENDDNEINWFKDNIFDCIPQEYESHRNTMLNSVSIKKLILNMNQLYNHFIKTEWKPNIIKKLQDKISQLKIDYDNLGTINISTSVFVEIKVLISKFIKSSKLQWDIVFKDDHKSEAGSSYDAYDCYYEILDKITKDEININIFVQTLHKNIDIFFLSEQKYKLCRFEKIRKYIHEFIDCSFNHLFSTKQKEICEELKIFILMSFCNKNKDDDEDTDEDTDEDDDDNSNDISVNKILSVWKSLINYKINYKLLRDFDDNFIFKIEDLVESDEYKIVRQKLKTEIDVANTSLNDINNLVV